MSLRTASLVLALAAASHSAGAAELLRDDFSNPATGWLNAAATRSTDLGFAVYTDTGGYQLTPVADQTFGFIPAPKQSAGGDVSIAADLFLYAGIGAGAAGLGCRFADHGNFYAFMTRGDAVSMILKIEKGEVTTLAQGTVASVMPGAVDTRLTAECRGDKLTLRTSTGGTLTARDTTFTRGQSGLFVIGEKMADTSATFDNFVLAD